MKRLSILSAVVLSTAILFLIFQISFPFRSFFVDETYAYSEDISIKLLIALIFSSLLLKLSSQLATLILGGVTGAVFFLSILGTKMIDPTQIGWVMRGDWQWHFIGWHFFRHEPWHFPLGKITNFFYPVGTSIGYTDSIPLLAFILKPFDSILPDYLLISNILAYGYFSVLFCKAFLAFCYCNF